MLANIFYGGLQKGVAGAALIAETMHIQGLSFAIARLRALALHQIRFLPSIVRIRLTAVILQLGDGRN